MDILEILDRIREFYSAKSDIDMGKILNVKPSTYSENKKKLLGVDTRIRKHGSIFYEKLIELCQKEQLNPAWVFFGKFPRKMEDHKLTVVKKDNLKNFMDDKYNTIKYYEDISNLEENDYIILPNNMIENKEYIAVKMPDESMDITIQKDSIILVDKDNKKLMDVAFVYLFKYQDKVQVRRLEKLEDRVLIHADNIRIATTIAKCADIEIFGCAKQVICSENIK